MKYVVSTFARVLSVLAILIFFAFPLYADPMIVLAASNNVDRTPWPTDPKTGLPTTLEFNTATDGAAAELSFVNNTNNVFTAFHFTFPNQPGVASGKKSTFFNMADGTQTTLDFFNDDPFPGTGIKIGDVFSIRMTGFIGRFNGVTTIRATPIFVVPEPVSILLLGTGLAGVAIKTRKKLKHRKSG